MHEKTIASGRTPLSVILIFALGVSFYPVGSAVSMDFDTKANECVKKGKVLLREGRYADAVQNLSGALLCASECRDAKEQLKAIAGLDAKSLEPGLRMRLLRYVELEDYIAFLEKRIEKFSVGDGRQEVASEVKSREFYCDDNIIIAGRALDMLLDRLSAIKEKYVLELTKVQKRNARARKMAAEVRIPSEQEEAQKELIRADESAAEEMESRAEEVDQQYFVMSDEGNQIQKNLEESEEKIRDLKQELTAKTLEVFEKESFIADQESSFSELESEVTDARQRLALVQRIIDEKNQKIQALEMHVQQVKVAAEENNSLSQKQLEELSLRFEMIQARFDEERKIRGQKMAALKKLLRDQKKDIALYMAIVDDKDGQIQSLKTRMVDLTNEVGLLKSSLDSKDNKLVELNGIIQIYKNKLAETNRNLRRRAAHIGGLRADLIETQKRLERSQNLTRDLHERIMSLESNLSQRRKVLDETNN